MQDAEFFETSAKEGINIQNNIDLILKKVVDKKGYKLSKVNSIKESNREFQGYCC